MFDLPLHLCEFYISPCSAKKKALLDDKYVDSGQQEIYTPLWTLHNSSEIATLSITRDLNLHKVSLKFVSFEDILLINKQNNSSENKASLMEVELRKFRNSTSAI